MNRKNEYEERLPIAEWPEIERKMAIIARMTSDPPLVRTQEDIPELQENAKILSSLTDKTVQGERNLPSR
ncbi:MAG: hypothetical protein JW779_13955 [Candidatus Thorarchaeota archaeon]|nr:hypothetical protein [Candidatus Thorarchaeota archaeon]